MITFLDDRDKAEIEETMTGYVQSVIGILELNWTDGGYVSKDDGAVYEEIGSSYSNFVSVEPGDRLIISNTMTSDTERNAFYDANETFKSSFSNASGTIVVPNGVYKMRLSKYTSASIVIVSEVSERIQRNKNSIDDLKEDLGQLSEEIANLPGTSDEQVQNAVNNYMANNPIEESDPTVPDWAKQPQKPTYTASEVGAEAAGTADGKVSAHNTAGDAHNDIRELISGLTQRLNALADSDDTTLDQMSEVVAYIKSNKSLIDAITTSKINVSDIIDNLTTNVSNKPLSAAQGVALKALIDAIPKTSTGMERIEKLSTDTAVELEPNKLYIFPEMAELAITLAEPSDTGIANEYHVVFQSGSTPTSLTIPSAIKLPSKFIVEANNVYRISILEGCLTMCSWYTIPSVFHVKIDSSLDYPYLFCWESDKNVGNTIWGDYWPGKPMVENENGWFTRELPLRPHNGNLHCIVTCEAGNNKTPDIDIDGSKSDVWITVNESYEYMVYYEEPVI